MDLDKLLQAVERLNAASSPEEAMRVLQEHPELLTEEVIALIRELALRAQAAGESQRAGMFTAVAEMLEQLRQAIPTFQTSIPPSSEPKAQWAKLVRQYLALRKEELLVQAIEAAEQAGEGEIVDLLRAFDEGNVEIVIQKAPVLHGALLKAGREEEAWTAALVSLDMQARWAEQFIYLPREQQAEALKTGLMACKQAARIAQALGDEPCAALYHAAAGSGYWGMRRLDKAEGAYREALEIYRCLAKEQPQVYEPDLAMTLNNLGNVLRGLRRLDEAERAYREALGIRRRLAKEQPQVYEPDLATTLNNLGNVLLDLRRLDEAERAYREALGIRRRLAKEQPQVYEPDLAMTLNNLGLVLRDLNRLDEAEEAYREALEIYRRYRIPDQLAKLSSNLGWLWMEQGRWEEAAEVLREGMEQVEQLRAAALSLDRRIQIMRENIHIYERLLICLMKLGRYQEALGVAERGKSRTLIDLLNLRDLRPRNAPPEVVEEYERMLFRARALEDEIRRPEEARREPEERERWIRRVEQARQELLEVHTRLRELAEVIRQHDPDFLPHARPLNVDEILALAEEANATLVLFRVTEKGCFVFLVFPNRTTDVVEVPEFTTDSLNEMLVKFEGGQPVDGWVWRYYEYHIAQAQGDSSRAARAYQRWLDVMDQTLGALYQRLLKPVHERLRQNRDLSPHLVLVPNRGLAIMPIHACWWEEDGARRYLLDEFIIRYAPSLSVFKRCLEREKKGRERETLLGVANPSPPGNLTFSEWECQEIERLLGHKRCLILWREKATKEEVLKWMGQRNWLHFSCHGQYRLDAPLESSLVLAGEKKLTLGEIFEKVHLPQAWLVALSACETGLVDFKEIADEHFGLPVGFLFAGVPTVYGSLWTVDDLSTALLMVKVYEELEKKGKSKPEALRDAQLWLRNLTAKEALEITQARTAWEDRAPWRWQLQFTEPSSQPFAHPYWWAAFQCVGV